MLFKSTLTTSMLILSSFIDGSIADASQSLSLSLPSWRQNQQDRSNAVWIEQQPFLDETYSNSKSSSDRSLQTQQQPACDTILATWTPEETSAYFFNALGNTDVAPILRATIASKFSYGVQIGTICATCREIMARLDPTTASSLNDVCGSSVYGANANMSGLVMLPLAPNSSRLALGTMKGIVYCRGTQTDTWPSIDFQGNHTVVEILQFAALTSLGGSVVLIPDYMGFGSSLGTLYKGYTVRKTYQTSFMPLWYKAQYTLAQTSNCSSVLSNHAAVVGYSEGGYASVAVAQVLTQAGVEVIHVDSGGAPFRVASSAILSIIKGVDDGTFPLDERYIFAVLGSAYSGTYPLPNSNTTSQYMLSSNVRDTIVQLVTSSASTDSLYAQVPINDPLSIYNQQFVALARSVIAAGIENPCNNNSSAFRNVVGEICDALVLNDLTDYLETQVNFPVRMCHSTQDTLVAYSNLPNISSNSQYLSLISGVTGTHQEASIYCVSQAFIYLISPDYQTFAVPNEAQSNGCLAPTLSPSRAPSPALAPLPTARPSSTQGMGNNGITSDGKHATYAVYSIGIALLLTFG